MFNNLKNPVLACFCVNAIYFKAMAAALATILDEVQMRLFPNQDKIQYDFLKAVRTGTDLGRFKKKKGGVEGEVVYITNKNSTVTK